MKAANWLHHIVGYRNASVDLTPRLVIAQPSLQLPPSGSLIVLVFFHPGSSTVQLLVLLQSFEVDSLALCDTLASLVLKFRDRNMLHALWGLLGTSMESTLERMIQYLRELGFRKFTTGGDESLSLRI